MPDVPNLGRVPLVGEQAKRAQAKAEAMAGMRCGGCHRRIGIGLHFTAFEAVVEDGAPTMVAIQLAACSRPDCHYSEEARDRATTIEMVEYVWVDEHGVDGDARFRPEPGNGNVRQRGDPEVPPIDETE